MSFRWTKPRRRRGGGALLRSTSSRRLSSVVNPDLLHDVAFHEMDQWSREAPGRRHSIASLGRTIAGIAVAPLSRRAASERVAASDAADAAALLDEWRENQRKEDGAPPKNVVESLGLDEVPEGRELKEEREAEQKSTTDVSSSWRLAILVFGLFVGYVLSSAALQQLNSLRPGCGAMVTLLQYIAVIFEKGPSASTYIFSNVLPMYWHALFVILMFLSVQMSNTSLGVGLPFGLFLVIKNTNLVFSLLFGLATGRSFTAGQIMSIAVVTAGVSVCVLAQQQGEVEEDSLARTETKSSDTLNIALDESGGKGGFLFGATLCVASTAFMALLGSIQEIIFARYRHKDGQECGESLFFTHLLGLPLFALGGGLDTMQDMISTLLKTPIVTISMLLLNIGMTLVVKTTYIELIEEGESLTATLAITVARMSGVVFSEILAAFGHGQSSASFNFWVGAMLVALGSLSYASGGKLPCQKVKRLQ